MKCPTCNREMTCRKGEHHYTESGLDNVWLEAIDICECQCGEKIIGISKVEEINEHIGHALTMKKSGLNGKEIRFLRKNMGFTALKLAKKLHVNNATISRWEKGTQPISDPHDQLLRILFLNEKGSPRMKIKQVLERDFDDTSDKEEGISYSIANEEISSH